MTNETRQNSPTSRCEPTLVPSAARLHRWASQLYLPQLASMLTYSCEISIEDFHPRVRAEIDNWPSGILADYARIVELLMEFGLQLRMPHSRAMGDALFELRPRGTEGVEECCIALWCENALESFTPL